MIRNVQNFICWSFSWKSFNSGPRDHLVAALISRAGYCIWIAVYQIVGILVEFFKERSRTMRFTEFQSLFKTRTAKNQARKELSKKTALLQLECRERIYLYWFESVNLPFFSATALYISLSFCVKVVHWKAYCSILGHHILLSSWRTLSYSWFSLQNTADDHWDGEWKYMFVDVYH